MKQFISKVTGEVPSLGREVEAGDVLDVPDELVESFDNSTLFDRVGASSPAKTAAKKTAAKRKPRPKKTAAKKTAPAKQVAPHAAGISPPEVPAAVASTTEQKKEGA